MAEVILIEVDCDPALYPKLNEVLGLDASTGAGDCPKGLLTHIGSGADGKAVVVEVWQCGGDQWARMATREDESRASAELLLICASVGTLIAVAFDLAKANQSQGSLEALLVAAGAATVVLSWGVLHTVFTLRYAHVFYTPPVGGVDFND